MKNELEILSSKLDRVIEQQELILKALNNKIVLDSHRAIPKYEGKTKVEMEIKQQLMEMFALKPHKIELQKKFNLKTQPHASRVKAYLKTNDPSVFDGLQRNK